MADSVTRLSRRTAEAHVESASTLQTSALPWRAEEEPAWLSPTTTNESARATEKPAFGPLSMKVTLVHASAARRHTAKAPRLSLSVNGSPTAA